MAVYWILPTKDFSWDGIGFAQAIESSQNWGAALIHPNHLLYNVLGYLAYHCALALGFHFRALATLQGLNGLLSASTAALIYSLLRKGVEKPLAAILTLGFSFSATWWKFSTDANAYIASVFLLVLCAHLLLSRSSPFRIGVVHASAMLIHELAIFFLPAAIFVLWQQSAGCRQQRFRKLGSYLATAGTVTIASYAFAFRLTHGWISASGLLHWADSHSQEAVFNAGPLFGLPYAIRGTIRLLVATTAYGQSCTRGCAVYRSALVVGIALCCVVLWLMSRRHGEKQSAEVNETSRPTLIGFAWMWIVPYLIFLVFWEPTEVFYRLFYLPPLVLLAGLALRWSSTRAMRLAALLLLLLVILNFQFLILPASRAENNWGLNVAQHLHQQWSPSTVIFYRRRGGGSIFDWTVRYFNPEADWRSEPRTIQQLETEVALETKNGRNVWLDTSAMQEAQRNTDFGDWMRAHSAGNETHDRLGRYELWYRQIKP